MVNPGLGISSAGHVSQETRGCLDAPRSNAAKTAAKVAAVCCFLIGAGAFTLMIGYPSLVESINIDPRMLGIIGDVFTILAGAAGYVGWKKEKIRQESVEDSYDPCDWKAVIAEWGVRDDQVNAAIASPPEEPLTASSPTARKKDPERELWFQARKIAFEKTMAQVNAEKKKERDDKIVDEALEDAIVEVPKGYAMDASELHKVEEQ